MFCPRLIIGGSSFLIVGMFHPTEIQCEYHFTDWVWPVFLAGGLLFVSRS
ncbi:MAG: DUF4491 family protein [Lachnospirales bacterium]